MSTRSVATCVEIPSESYAQGYATLVVNADPPAYYQCSYIDLEVNATSIVRYQSTDSVGTDWTDISNQTGEGVFALNSVLQNVSTFDISQLDPQIVAGYVGAGFFTLLPLWAAVFGGRQLINAIRS